MKTNDNVKKVLDLGAYHRNELWKLVRELLRLSDCNVQKLEDKIFPTYLHFETQELEGIFRD